MAEKGLDPTPSRIYPSPELLKACGVSLGWFRWILVGKKEPTLRQAILIAEWLGVSIERLFPEDLRSAE